MFVNYTWDHIKTDNHINLPSETAMKLPAFIRCMGDWTEGPLYITTRKESFNYYLLYTISGRGRVFFRNKQIILEPGMAVLLDSYDFVEYNTYECDSWHNLWFHIYGNGVRSFFDIINPVDSFNAVFINDNDKVLNFYNSLIPLYNSTSLSDEIKISKIILDFLYDIIEDLDFGQDKGDSVPEWITEIEYFVDRRINSKLTIADIARHFNIPPLKVESDFLKFKQISVAEYILERERFYNNDSLYDDVAIRHSHPQWLIDAVAYIEDNYSNNIVISDLVRSSFVSKPIFLREFRRYTGMNPKDYITHIRIKNSLLLLQNTLHSITRIANSCGYNSSSLFTKTFKEWTGKSPKEYRKHKG